MIDPHSKAPAEAGLGSNEMDELEAMARARGYGCVAAMLDGGAFFRRLAQHRDLYSEAVQQAQLSGEPVDATAAFAILAEPERQLLIVYQCPLCQHGWDDQWSSAVDSDCPQCNTRDIMPVTWSPL